MNISLSKNTIKNKQKQFKKYKNDIIEQHSIDLEDFLSK